MNSSLISATSILALCIASTGLGSTGPGSAAVVKHKLGSSDFRDAAVDNEPSSISAVPAFNAVSGAVRSASFTGPVDTAAAAGDAFPATPLGAAQGTAPINDFASSVPGNGLWNTARKARVTGQYLIAPLIGGIGEAALAGEKSSSTVFVAAGSQIGFNEAGRSEASRNAFAQGSSRTATITVPSARTTPRQSVAAVPYVAIASGGDAKPPDVDAGPQSLSAPETTSRPSGMRLAPMKLADVTPNRVAAEFSDAVTAKGDTANIARPALPGKVQSSDGTRTILSASVSVGPPAAADYLASIIRAAPADPSAQTIETFQMGPASGSRSLAGQTTSVADPLSGKIVTGVGALNNLLALP
jgi:hypothetical protein